MTQLNINFDFCFFTCANLCGTEKTKKNHQKHTQINYSVDPVTLHQVKVCVPQFVGNWVDWVYLRFWGTTLPSMERSGGCRSRRITSSCWGHWCVFLRCWGSDKEKQGHLNSTEDRYRKSLKEAMWMYTGKKAMEVFGSDFCKIFHICIWLQKK